MIKGNGKTVEGKKMFDIGENLIIVSAVLDI
jgi:hypothetical protein